MNYKLSYFGQYLPLAFLFFSSLIILRLQNIIKKRVNGTNSSTRLPPSPPKLPLLGNLHQLGELRHRSLASLSKKYGPLMLLHLGQVKTLIVSSPAAAREVLRTNDHIFASRPPFKAAKLIFYNTSDFVFAPYGEQWRQMRKITTIHLLSSKKVRSYQSMREEVVSLMISKISNIITTTFSNSNCGFDLSKVLKTFTVDMICKVIADEFFTERRRVELLSVLDETNTVLGCLFVEDCFPFFGWLDEFTKLTKTAKRNALAWDDILDELSKFHDVDSSDDKNENFVSVLLSHCSSDSDFKLSGDMVKALLLDVFSAGFETSYITLEWTMAELMKRPELMKKLQTEVRDIVGSETMVKEEKINEMIYLKAIVKEVLRLHPVVPLFVPHELMKDSNIQGYDIPKKTQVFINAWAIARDPSYWELPEEFLPERFLNNDVDFKGNDFQFIPFGAGRRICPGMNLAIHTIELALANLVHVFDWELTHGLKVDEFDMCEEFGLTTRKKKSLNLVAKYRKD